MLLAEPCSVFLGGGRAREEPRAEHDLVRSAPADGLLRGGGAAAGRGGQDPSDGRPAPPPRDSGEENCERPRARAVRMQDARFSQPCD